MWKAGNLHDGCRAKTNGVRAGQEFPSGSWKYVVWPQRHENGRPRQLLPIPLGQGGGCTRSRRRHLISDGVPERHGLPLLVSI